MKHFRRPREGGDPYAVSSRFGTVAEAFCNDECQGLWVPACGGTTSQSTFAGTGFSVAVFATRAAFAVSASAAIFFCVSEPGCTTPQDMIRVAASSALISTSISLLFGT